MWTNYYHDKIGGKPEFGPNEVWCNMVFILTNSWTQTSLKMRRTLIFLEQGLKTLQEVLPQDSMMVTWCMKMALKCSETLPSGPEQPFSTQNNSSRTHCKFPTCSSLSTMKLFSYLGRHLCTGEDLSGRSRRGARAGRLTRIIWAEKRV